MKTFTFELRPKIYVGIFLLYNHIMYYKQTLAALMSISYMALQHKKHNTTVLI
jgi:hypothetical protein